MYTWYKLRFIVLTHIYVCLLFHLDVSQAAECHTVISYDNRGCCHPGLIPVSGRLYFCLDILSHVCLRIFLLLYTNYDNLFLLIALMEMVLYL